MRSSCHLLQRVFPSLLGLVVATVMHGSPRADRRTLRARCCSSRRSCRWSRRVSRGAGSCRRPVWSTRCCRAVGFGGVTRAWLGDFGTALPAVGVIGAWVLLGLCTVLLLPAWRRSTRALYEAAQLDGAGPVREFISITLPSLRQEIGVCVTVTVIAALSAFDIVYIATRGGPGIPDNGSGPRDLPAGVLQSRGRARLGARRGADGCSSWSASCRSSGTRDAVPTSDRLSPEHVARGPRF